MHPAQAELIAKVVRIWRRTLRFQVEGFEQNMAPGGVVSVWHGRMMGVIFHLAHRGVITMASRSGDGEVAAKILDGLGYEATRGSTSRGGSAAFREILGLARGRSPCLAGLTVDGPKGPPRQTKAGAIALAQLLRLPIVPASFTPQRPILLRSWDRMVLARPFSTVHVRYGEPIEVPRGEDAAVSSAKVDTAIDAIVDALDLEILGRLLWED